MIAFEKYLISNGWKVFNYKFVNKKCVDVEGYITPSTMGNIFNTYKKAGKKIIVGLSEFGKPITLCYPRPENVFRDDEMNKILNEYKDKYEELLKEII